MKYDNIEQKIQKLTKNGMKENIDFRVVYFGNNTELKIIKKII